MEVTEVGIRLVRRFWPMLLVAIVFPTLAVAALVLHSPRTYTAHARIIAAATVPQAQAQSDAVVSQVQAIATSEDVMATALSSAGIDRDPAAAVKNVTVTGVGSSGVVDLAYTDTSAADARRVAMELTSQVVSVLANMRSGIPTAVADLDQLVTLMTTRRAEVQAAGGSQNSATLASINQVITDLTNDRDKLQVLESTTAMPTVVDGVGAAQADGRGLAPKLAITALLGLVVGLILIGLNETLRPGVSGAGRVARLLAIPTLGKITSDAGALADIGRRIRLASRQAGVSIVVLIRADRTPVSPELVDRIQAATLRPEPVKGQTVLPIDGVDGSIAAARNGAAATQTIPRMTLDGAFTSVSPALAPAQVCAFDELDPHVEGEPIGLVVLTVRSTRLTAVDGVRDLVGAAGWPLLGVLDDPRNRSGA